jgi:hypothetical protein
MTGGDLLDEAVAELYSADPEEFMRRRQELTARARSAGQPPVAKQIAALRKPTRVAWIINSLARSDPGSIVPLTELGAELRAVERSGDGTRLRELSQARRRLLTALVRQALEASGQAAATATLREEITATFAAALADPEVAGQIQQGTLVRAERRAGFGSSQAPALTVVPPLPASHRAPRPAPAKPAPIPARAGQPAGGIKEAQETKAAARARVAQEERQAKARAKAEESLAQAQEVVAAAVADQRDQEKAVRGLERELGQARIRLRSAEAEVRRAEAAERRARHARDQYLGGATAGKDTGQ